MGNLAGGHGHPIHQWLPHSPVATAIVEGASAVGDDICAGGNGVRHASDGPWRYITMPFLPPKAIATQSEATLVSREG